MKHQLDARTVYCAILGDGEVGKTSIADSYLHNAFSDEETVFDNYAVPVNVAGEEFTISMFDTSDKAEYESLRSFTHKQSEVIVLCFSTSDRDSFLNVHQRWLPELKRHSKSSKQKRPVILVGTQADLRGGYGDHEVSYDEGHQLAKDIGADCYVECSARDQKGLKEVFQHVVFSALKFRKKRKNILKQFLRKVLPSSPPRS